MTSRVPALLALSVGSVLVLAGCATATAPAAGGGDRLSVVASTNVYGSLAAAVGGDDVEVTSIIDSLSQDPHSYEASARDQLTVSQADLVIENGGGYDAFLDGLIEATGTEAPVITAVEYSHDYPGNEGHSDDAHAEGEDHDHAEDGDHAGHDHIEGFNEHVWYDPHTMEHVVEDIAHELGELDAAKADTFEANAKKLIDGIARLEGSLEQIKTEHAGEKIFVTEPVPLYLTAAAGLENATPEAFSEAVEEGQDVPPATMLEATDILDSGEVRTVIVNAQTGGAETTEVEKLAATNDISVLKFTELLPEGLTYVEWMQQNIDELADSLTR
ncbi:metal ABC transporter solute-binding protein, Zn/Mn family [Microbacterium sp. NPDC077663]|uniref:metal ABC transporter solute-binding protein, Zn/Mn family n=1 Tax=Microbacterium sp. NPDC077663 TaxID=3364189 RepID=UPI0037CC7632